MLSYSVGERRTDVFVVAEEIFEVHTVALGEAELRREILSLRELIELATPETSVGALRSRDLERVSRRLYRSLIGPAEAALAGSDRALVIPDGSLHLLPFGILLRDHQGKRQFLAEWKPLHTALPATVYAELKKTRRGDVGRGGETRLQVAAFGDPSYPRTLRDGDPANIADVRVRNARDRCGFAWSPLPYTSREVKGIADFFSPENARVYLGAEATEERAKSLASDTRILHFAVHSCLDDRFPLHSALALTIPEELDGKRDNGLLQVWEIFESVRLEADLVVLSACETGLGQEQGGEGLIGLTRAFQYAGARSVAASLWTVRDQATAELMVRFYRHLRAGVPKDEALRAAQLELIRGPVEVVDDGGNVVTKDWSAPYYWAAFQIYGDWR